MYRIVVETNVLVAIIGRKSPFRWIFDRILFGDFILCLSNEILTEYAEILEQKNGPEVATNLVNFLAVYPYVQKTEIYFSFNLISQDADDNKFVDCAISADAYCLVSNDGHFNVLRTLEFPAVNVLTLAEFEREFAHLKSKPTP